MSKITGQYTDPWFGKVHLTFNDDKVIFSADRSPGLQGEVNWYKSNTYVVKWYDRGMDADAFILFETDFKGEISGMKMRAISPLTDFSFDFHDLSFKKK